MRESRFTFGLVLGAHVVPDTDSNNRGFAIFMHYYCEAVIERELVVGNIDVRHLRG